MKTAKSGPGAVIGLYYKQADAAGAGNAIFHIKAATSKIDLEALKILAETEPFAPLPWAVSSTMEKTKAAKVQEWMLGLDKNQEGVKILKKAKIDRFIPISDADFDSIAKIMGVKAQTGQEQPPASGQEPNGEEAVPAQ